ncbi:copper transporter [Aeromicrobium terrae]|uniref:copper transporter n=1 Tax=Aeromicrobium terrae TaxID=2498846 RepID=UPI0016500E2D|nr:copper transporter [Aeromicrobium terrae]
MINFRYHLVSIAAILLALAAGIALGSGPLDDATSGLTDDNGSDTAADPGLARFETGYAGLTSGALLKDKLKGHSVVVLTLPGARAEETKDIRADLEKAGATVTGEVQLTAKLIDPSNRQFAEGVAQQAGEGVKGVTSAGDSYGRIGAALGRSVLGTPGRPIDSVATTISSAFTEGDLVTYAAKPKTVADLAVVVASPSKVGETGQVVAQLVKAVDASGKGAVLAGPSSSSRDGGSVAALRDNDASAQVSSVDVTDTAAGRVVVALALAREAAGQSGAWGTSRSADGAVPR